MTLGGKSAQKEKGDKKKGPNFRIAVKLLVTGELFKFTEIYNEKTFAEVMADAELIMGMPKFMQRLRYLDECDILEVSTIKRNDIVAGAQLNMTVWNLWVSLVKAVVSGDVDLMLQMGVTPHSTYTSPNLEYMTQAKRRAHLGERAFVALFIAAHRGHQKLVERLIAEGVDVNMKTSLGRTALHAAAATGQGEILQVLLENGADINIVDNFGLNALDIAEKFGHKTCARALFMYRWQQRAKNVRPSAKVPLFAHQLFDSSLATHMRGPFQQMYMECIQPGGEFAGSGFGAKKRVASRREVEFETESEMSFSSGGSARGLPRIKEEKRGMKKHKNEAERKAAFDAWLAKKQAEDAIRLAREREEKLRKKQEEEQKLVAQNEDREFRFVPSSLSLVRVPRGNAFHTHSLYITKSYRNINLPCNTLCKYAGTDWCGVFKHKPSKQQLRTVCSKTSTKSLR